MRAINTNWSMLTAQNNSNSNDRSCLTLQMQIGMEMRLTKTSGTKTRIHKWRPDCKLSATKSSNISNRRWVAKLINMALYWMYSSALRWFWGRRHQTMDPTMAPDTKSFISESAFKVYLCIVCHNFLHFERYRNSKLSHIFE